MPTSASVPVVAPATGSSPLRIFAENPAPITDTFEAVAPGASICERTAARWATKGLRGAVLETVRLGNRRLTSRRAMIEFLERIQHGGDA